MADDEEGGDERLSSLIALAMQTGETVDELVTESAHLDNHSFAIWVGNKSKRPVYRKSSDIE